MTKKELLSTYRAILIELEEIQHQLNRIGSDGRPSGSRSAQTDAVPRGTNNPAAAAIQLADGLEVMKHQKEAELALLGKQIDLLLKEIKDFRTYCVIQQFYLFAKTDEQVAQTMSMSRSRVNQIRIEYLNAV